MKLRKGMCILISICMLFTLLTATVNATPERLGSEDQFTDEFLAAAPEHQFEGVEVGDLRQILEDERQIYQNFRVQSDYTGTRTYRVPVQTEEIEYL